MNTNERTTPNFIDKLNSNEIFVFGSNLSGLHYGGAAKIAMKWGAELNKGTGLQGRTYAIPTKDYGITRSLTVSEIKPHVTEFIKFAKINSNFIFLVTEIGCGLAGFSPNQIAPLFKAAVDVDNIYLPEKFWNILSK